MGKASRRRRERKERPIVVDEPCAAQGCAVLGLYRGPMINGSQLWLCWPHLQMWLADEGKRATVGALQEYIASRVWAKPISRFDRG